MQAVFAGNDSEGLRYGTVGTPELLFLPWKEDEAIFVVTSSTSTC